MNNESDSSKNCHEVDIVCNKWKRLDQIGRGTFGQIFKGQNIKNNKLVALKYIVFHSRSHAKSVGNEIKCMRLLATACKNSRNSSNIVNIRGYNYKSMWQGKEAAVLVFDYMKNGSLYDFLFKLQSGLNESIGHKYFLQLIDAINHCHKLGIIHRDISLQNLLLNSKFELKLADFGWASIIKTQSKSLSVSSVSGCKQREKTEDENKENKENKENRERETEKRQEGIKRTVSKQGQTEDRKQEKKQENKETKEKKEKKDRHVKPDRKLVKNVDGQYCFGTAGYQAPEILLQDLEECNNNNNKGIDIFSCGVVLFIMLSGYRPFNDAKKNDNSYKYIYNKDYASFWKWHSKRYGFKSYSNSKDTSDRSKDTLRERKRKDKSLKRKKTYVSRSAIDLITRMIIFDKNDRISLNDIMKHPWYLNGNGNGKKLTQEEIQLVMSSLYEKYVKNNNNNTNNNK